MSETAKFCTACGEPIHGNRFCASCGAPTGVEQAETPALAAAASAGAHADAEPEPITNGASHIPAATQPLPVTERASAPPRFGRAAAAPPPPTTRRGLSRGVAMALIGGAVVIVVAVVVVVLSGGSKPAKSSATGATYGKQVATAFGPVLGANAQLSDTLIAIRGTDPADAKLAVSRALHAATVASGALSALHAPSDSAALAREARQVIDRETAYLAGISAVLNHPSVAGASQLQTLASNLTSALDSAGPTVAGTAPTVSGADRLTAWAGTTSRTLSRRAAAAKRTAASKRTSSGSTSAPVVLTANPYANGRGCGAGVFAGPNTSCAFALNVRGAYDNSGGSSTIRAFSPTTGQSYTMFCASSGPYVTCSGGNDASVTF